MKEGIKLSQKIPFFHAQVKTKPGLAQVRLSLASSWVLGRAHRNSWLKSLPGFLSSGIKVLGLLWIFSLLCPIIPKEIFNRIFTLA